MYYVGLDVHLRHSNLCILDERGRQVKARTVRGPWPKLLEALRRIDQPFAVCYEASCGYGYLHDQLVKTAQRVVVAHPGQLRLIFRSKRKNDRVDAQKLAKLLFLDEVPGVYVPAAEVRSWRAMIEHRTRLVRKRTRTKNGVRALLRGLGVSAPRGLWNKKGRAWLAQVGLADAYDRLRLDMLLEELDQFERQVVCVEKALDQRAAQHAGVRLLRTIPGVGPRTAEAFVAYIDQPQRFSRNKAIGAYLGLVPRQDQSGAANRLGHITGDGPATLRKLLTEAAWQGVRYSPAIKAYFDRLIHGDGQRRKIALVATAHYLARVMLAMLTTGELWREQRAAA